jgi:hypothetical protein
MDSRLRGNDGESLILIFVLIRDPYGGITNKTAWAEAHPTFWRDTNLKNRDPSHEPRVTNYSPSFSAYFSIKHATPFLKKPKKIKKFLLQAAQGLSDFCIMSLPSFLAQFSIKHATSRY